VRKLLALVFPGPLLAISIVTLSLITSTLVFTPANAAPNSIEIISISEVSSTSVEILFESSVPKKSLVNYVITAAVDPSVGQPKNIKKIIKTKATGLITAEIKNLNPKVAYKFSVSAKTNKGKMINSEAVEYYSLSNLMDVLSNLPADWGNPKPIPTPTAAPTAAPVAAPAANVAITQASIGTARNTAFTTQPIVTIRDSSNNTVTTSSAVVTATVSVGATLVGTTTATASSGVATFTGLGVNGTIGTEYTITYTSGSLTSATATVTLTSTTCDGTFTCQVGDTGPGGGIVYYVSASDFTSTGSTCDTSCKYLEVAPSGWNGGTDPQKPWATGTYESGNTILGISGITNDATAYNNASGIGLGYANSSAIVTQNGIYSASTNNYAAGAARAYTGGSKTDWYLPTTAELNLLCQWNLGVTSNVTTVCTGGSLNSPTYGAGSSGFLVANFYWSSSEETAVSAWVQTFLNGAQGTGNKASNYYVRPVRAF
jgi:hypothetical protein